MMNYNIHPLFVHFPIAFLFIYSVLKLLPLARWFPKTAWRDIERSTLVIGLLGALIALATGDAAEELTNYNRQIIEIHANFAGLATALYGMLILGELATFFNERAWTLSASWDLLKRVSRVLERILGNRVVVIILSLLSLIAIMLTGLFGGVIVYGATADPIAPYLLKLFGVALS